MIDPISLTAGTVVKEAAAQIAKEGAKETVKQTFKEIARAKSRELAIKAGSEIGRELIRAVGDVAEECMRNEDGAPTPAGRLILMATREMAAKVPLENGIRKLLSGTSVETSSVKSVLSRNGIEARVFTGDKSLNQAIKNAEVPTTRTFIVKGEENLWGFAESLEKLAGAKHCDVQPGRVFGILGARSVSVMPANEPIVAEFNRLPSELKIGKAAFRLEDLARAGMSIDYAVEVTVVPLSSVPELKPTDRIVGAIDPGRLSGASKTLECTRVAEAKSWLAGEGIDLTEKKYITPGDIKSRIDLIEQIGLENYLIAKGETDNKLNPLIERSCNRLAEARKCGPGAVDAEVEQLKQFRKGPAGEFGRQLMADAESPFAESVSFEVPHAVGDRTARADDTAERVKNAVCSTRCVCPQGRDAVQ